MSETIERADLTTRAVRSGSWLFGARFIGRALTLVQVLVLARLLTPEQFGIIAIAYIALEFLRTFTEAGLELALIQRASDISAHMNTAWTVTVLRGVLLAAILVVGGPAYASFFDQAEAGRFVQAFAVPVLLAGLVNIGLVHFKKNVQYDKLVVYEVAPSVVGVAVTIAVAVATRSVWALWWGQAAKASTAVLASYAIHPFRPSFGIVGRHFRDLIGYSKWIYATSILLFFLNQGDDIAVGRIEGTIALGLYQVAFKVARMPVTEVNSTLSRVLFPAFSEIQSDIPRLRNAYLTSVSTVLLVTAPFCFGIYVVAPYAIPGLLGDKWLDAIAITQVFALLGLLVSIGSTTSNVFRAIGAPDITTKAQLVRGAVMFTLLFPMMERWGAVGAAWAVVASELTIGGYLLVRVCSVLDARLSAVARAGFVQLAAAAVMALVVWAAALVPSDPTVSFVSPVLIAGGAVVYLAVVMGLDRLTGGELIGGISKRLRSVTRRPV